MQPFHMRFARASCLLLLGTFFCINCKTPGESSSTKDSGAKTDEALRGIPTPREMAPVAVTQLAEGYSRRRGVWSNTAWWNSANALEALIDYSRLTGSGQFKSIISATYSRHFGDKFLNEFNDDSAWWALAWIKAYDLTHHSKYLKMAQVIFDDISQHWDDHCGGGVWWKKDHKYKNAITNELFLTLAVRLHLRSASADEAATYRAWADRTWNWFKQTGMIRADHLISDGLETDCRGVGQTFTYNQGVILAALADYSKISQNTEAMQMAEQIAHAAMSQLIDQNGILRDEGEVANSPNPDQPQFKGIFMRNLAYLYTSRPNPDIRQFVLHNLKAVWTLNRTDDGQFGYLWGGPFDKADGARQTSAVDLINAAIVVSQPNLALGRIVTSNVDPCTPLEAQAMAVDGSVMEGSKWCARGQPNAFLTLDLGSPLTIHSFRVKHAEAGGEAADLNTETFSIDTSSDGSNWTQAVFVTNNKSAVTEHPITALTARYVRLNILRSQSRPSLFASRIYEFEVIGDGLYGEVAGAM